MYYVNENMIGNKISDNIDDVKFNIIKKTNISFIGEILFGFLKHGTLKIGMKINNQIILSIHNNMIDCNEISAPATISIRLK
jgi:hypothetical protein